MALDRFVYFRRDRRPTKLELGVVLSDYLGPKTARVSWNAFQSRFYATLVGRPSNPFRRIDGVGPSQLDLEPQEERWFEVYVAYRDDALVEVESVDVITRLADTYTNVVAEGYAKLVARFWDGDLEQG